MLTKEQAQTIVEQDPNGIGSSIGLLQYISSLDDGLAKLQSLGVSLPPAEQVQQPQQQQPGQGAHD